MDADSKTTNNPFLPSESLSVWELYWQTDSDLVQCHLIGAADQEVKCFQDTQWGEHPSARQCTVRRKQLPAMAAAYLGADHNHHADHNKHLPRGQSLAEGVGHHHFTTSMWTVNCSPSWGGPINKVSKSHLKGSAFYLLRFSSNIILIAPINIILLWINRLKIRRKKSAEF